MTEQGKSFNLANSNIQTFYDITRDSIKLMNASIESGRRPKPNGEPGWIIAYDPEQKSFKAALIAITFSGVYLEALLHLLIVEKHGIKTYKNYDRRKYEDKLKLLECNTASIMDECEHYRDVRREIVHEKAYLDVKNLRWAQKEATRAFKLVELINAHFEVKVS